MKILLVEPPKKIWELMGSNCVSPPLGLLQLASVLEREKIETEVIDCNASGMDWSDLQKYISDAQPNVIGATAMTPFFYQALKVMHIAKSVNPESITILGGPHVTFTSEETLEGHPEVDIIVRGEGERSLVELIRCLENQGDLYRVKGIAFHRNGKVVETLPQPPVDVNSLPLPAYHLLPMEKYHFTVLGNFTTLLSSRGCPYRCTFCSEWRFWNSGWRPREPVLVVDEMELLQQKYNRDCFWFGDDCFNIKREHIYEICEEILKRRLEVSWYYQGRADFIVKYKDLLPLMRRAGNLMAQIGIETSTSEEMKEFNKCLELDKIKEAIALLKRNGIVSQGLLLIGTRRDSAKSITHKLQYMKWLDPDFPIFTMYTPFPGTDVYEEAKTNNWLETLDYSHYDMAHPIMSTEYLSRNQIMSWYYWCFSSYYFDLIKIAKGLLSRNRWKRQIWWYMIRYSLKQAVSSLARGLIALFKL